MRYVTLALAVLLFARGARADIVIKGPDKAQAGDLVVLSAETDALPKQIVWRVETKDRKKVKFVKVEGQKAVAFSGLDGEYYVTATRYLLDKESGAITPEEAEFVVVLGRPTPPPPPDPPAPTDTLTKALLDAYAADGSGDKAKHVAAYAALCRQISLADLRNLRTAGELRTFLTTTRKSMGVPDDALVPLRKVVDAQMREFLPTQTDAALTQDHLAATSNLMAKVAKALTGVK